MKKILVTGGAGFIGHYVVEKLESLQYDVSVIDCVTNYGILNKSELNWLHARRTKNFKNKILFTDLVNHNLVSTQINQIKPEIILHLAAFPRAKVVDNNPQLGSQVLINALINLLESALSAGCKKFIYVSSSMVYGNFNDSTKENYPCSPIGFYGILKYSGELLVKDFCKKHNIDYIIIRPSAVYGPNDVEDRVVSKFLINALKNKDIVVHGIDESLDFSYVQDVANGIILTIYPEIKNETYNITRGKSRSLLDAAKIAVNVTNSSSKIIIKDKNLMFPSRGSLNIQKAYKDLNFKPSVDIEEGFKLYADWLTTSIFLD